MYTIIVMKTWILTRLNFNRVALQFTNLRMLPANLVYWCFQETVALRMHINTCELSHYGTKSASDHLQVFYHFLIKLQVKTISTTIEVQLD